MNVSDFALFFKGLHGHSPFPWQSDLMTRVVDKGWPGVLDLPTSAGKTAAIDLALFHLALEAEKLPQERKAPRRVFFVVDRRLVVDEAYERACRIQNRLHEAFNSGQGLLTEAAKRLKSLAAEPDAEPVEVLRLRGGLPRERVFLRNPLQPAIVLSTVDQVGSRLLFRGYGVSEGMRPLHGALVGVDSLIILDEAHLSRPFTETLRWVQHYQTAAWTEQQVGKPTIMVQMTATPPEEKTDVFRLTENAKDWEHPVLGPRLICLKQAELLIVNGNKDDLKATQSTFVGTLTAEAKTLLTTLKQAVSSPVIGIVVNRVATARHVFEQLRCEKEADAVLLTGRIRAFEREELIASYLPRMKAGRADDVNPRPLYVVATQTVEVGADLDFDALVTEAASLDALRQRFGRLNRFGKRDHCRAVIVYVSFGRSSEPDPIYGKALVETWKWMEKTAHKPKGKKSGQRRKVLDFGAQAIEAALLNGEALADLLTHQKSAPVLMPSHMDMLVQTSPVPMVEPEIALQLHGVETGLEDVQIVWRADLWATLGSEDEETAIETVAILPPIQLETVAVPIWVVRAWLRGEPSGDVADVEGSNQVGERIRNNHFRLAVRWRGDRESRLFDPGDIRPGDTIVVPATYGGHDSFGWNPDHNQAVLDIADFTALQQRGKFALRMHPSLLPQWFEADDLPSEALHALEDVISRHTGGESLPELCDELIERLLELSSLKQGVRDALVGLQKNRREFLYPSAKRPEGILLQERKNVAREFTDEDDSSSLTREVLLEGHCEGVGDLAETFASHLGIGETLVNDVGLSGKLHDLGKADPRFQIWLQGGDRILTRKGGKLLAKSGKMGVTDWHARRVARERAGYPKGARHECYSVAIAMSNNLVLDGAHDKDLVLYLIGVHHGFGRPLMPSVKDEGVKLLSFEFDGKKLGFSGQHGLERLESGWADRFWLLVRRYGYWGLAYLETLVRLADHRRSELGE